MTSFGASSIEGQSGFQTTFKVQGQIYHKASSLFPLPSENAKFLHIYFLGNEDLEVDQWCDYTTGVRRDIVLNLQRMFHEHNQLIKTFKTALEDMPSDECKLVIRADKRPVGEHKRRFNGPQINEVPVVIAASDWQKWHNNTKTRQLATTHCRDAPLIWCSAAVSYTHLDVYKRQVK